MFWGGRLAFETFGLEFLWTDAWDPVSQKFGALVPIYGTLVTAFIAMLIAVPVSFGIAMFLTEIAPQVDARPGRRGDRTARRHPVDHLRHVGPVRARAVPGRTRLSLARRAHRRGGRSSAACSPARRSASACCTAGLVLAIMVIPFIASVMREVFLTVPGRLKESAYALGSTTLGSGVGRRAALHALGGDRRHLPRPGPRARRNDGRHLRARQRARTHRRRC